MDYKIDEPSYLYHLNIYTMKPMYFKNNQPQILMHSSTIQGSDSPKRGHWMPFFLLPVLVMVFLSSCVTQRKMEYMRTLGLGNSQFEVVKNNENKSLLPGDELYIQVYSFTNNIASSIGTEGTSSNITPYSAAIISYKINHDSTIMFPLIGMYKIAGYTIPQAEQRLQSMLTSYLNNPSVNIKIVNTNISIIGEVAHPGNYTYTNAPLNIFQALSLAGDISQFGDRQNVRIIRQKDKHVDVFTIDLNTADIITSKYFFLEANDVIYVRPLKRRIWGLEKFPYELVFSAISSTILILSYQKTFGK